MWKTALTATGENILREIYTKKKNKQFLLFIKKMQKVQKVVVLFLLTAYETLMNSI